MLTGNAEAIIFSGRGAAALRQEERLLSQPLKICRSRTVLKNYNGKRLIYEYSIAYKPDKIEARPAGGYA